jgi:hypothetical protein
VDSCGGGEASVQMAGGGTGLSGRGGGLMQRRRPDVDGERMCQAGQQPRAAAVAWWRDDGWWRQDRRQRVTETTGRAWGGGGGQKEEKGIEYLTKTRRDEHKRTVRGAH